MEQHDYKGHRILISGWQIGEAQWIGEYKIAGEDSPEDDPTDIPVSYRFEEEAKAAALRMAKAWLDGARTWNTDGTRWHAVPLDTVTYRLHNERTERVWRETQSFKSETGHEPGRAGRKGKTHA
jgi:hypothetical protein